MRIAFFSTSYSLQGGAERCQELIVRHMMQRGHEAHVIVRTECELSEHYRSIGARVHVTYWHHLQKLTDPVQLGKYFLWLPILAVRLARLLRRERINVLHVNEILDFPGLIAARLAGVPGVVFYRVIFRYALLRPVLAALGLILARRVVCVSHAVHRMALRSSRSPKVRVIYDGGPDYGRFDPDHVQPIRPPGAEGKLVIGMVAKYVAVKGHLAFLDLAARLRDGGRENLSYVIVGGPVPGHEAYEAELLRRRKQRGLEALVHLAGAQREVAPHIAGMDIVCHLPLTEDPLPGVPMEAAAMGKPVLSFVSGGVPEELTHPTSARLVAIGDIEALADHACQLIDDPSLRRRIGQNARREIRAKFSIKGHLAQIDKLFEEVTRPARESR